MSLLKSIDRLKRIDSMIRRQATGTSDEFARKLGISRSMLMENLREMKELGAEICFCPHRRSYFYANEFGLLIGKASKNRIRGGSSIWTVGDCENILGKSNRIGHLYDTLAKLTW